VVFEEEAHLGREGLVVAEDVLEGGDARAVRVGALADLRELVRVAKEHERPRGAARRDDVGEGHLACFVHEEDVQRPRHLLAGQEPLGRIGYHVYYRLAPRLRRVEVVAFWHARRGSPPPL
jgi:hypothetical protein